MDMKNVCIYYILEFENVSIYAMHALVCTVCIMVRRRHLENFEFEYSKPECLSAFYTLNEHKVCTFFYMELVPNLRILAFCSDLYPSLSAIELFRFRLT